MNIVIIEDELDAYKRLSRIIGESIPGSSIIAHLESVEAARQWFGSHTMPDIVFIDINLGDGTGFDVLNLVRIDCPFVITTAHDEYAVQAFRTNSIAYLLKPVTGEDLKSVWSKIAEYNRMFGKPSMPAMPKHRKRFIIRYGDYIKVITVEEIAMCYVQTGGTFVRTTEGRAYPIDYNLETLQEMLDPGTFFRLNRQYLVHLSAIAEIRTHSRGRIIVRLREPDNSLQTVSAERAAEFRAWLADET